MYYNKCMMQHTILYESSRNIYDEPARIFHRNMYAGLIGNTTVALIDHLLSCEFVHDANMVGHKLYVECSTTEEFDLQHIIDIFSSGVHTLNSAIYKIRKIDRALSMLEARRILRPDNSFCDMLQSFQLYWMMRKIKHHVFIINILKN